MKAKRNSKTAIAVIKSKATGLLYIGMIIDDQPYKVWKLNDMSPAGVDFCNELMKAYDLGYSIEFQLPTIVDEQRQIVPLIYNLNDAEEEKASDGTSPIKEAVGKLLKPADVPVFEEYDKDDAVISDKCGITDEFMEDIQSNADSSPVEFVDSSKAVSEVPTEEAPIVPAPAPIAPTPIIPAPAPVAPESVIAPVPEPVVESDPSSVAVSPVNQQPIVPQGNAEFQNADLYVPQIPPEDEFFAASVSVEPTIPEDLCVDPPQQPTAAPSSPFGLSIKSEPKPAPAPSSTEPEDPFSDMFPPVTNKAAIVPEVVPATTPVSVTGGTPIMPQAASDEEEMAVCINGHSTPKKGKFCIHCGAKVLDTLSDSQPPVNRTILNNPYDAAPISASADNAPEHQEAPANNFLNSYIKSKR